MRNRIKELRKRTAVASDGIEAVRKSPDSGKKVSFNSTVTVGLKEDRA